MNRHIHACGHFHDCDAPDPAAGLADNWDVVALTNGWYDDEDRMGYEQGHQCCPDCGDDPDDHTAHRNDCPRTLPIGHPLEYLQFGPPWHPWPEDGQPLDPSPLPAPYQRFVERYVAEHASPARPRPSEAAGHTTATNEEKRP